MTRFEKHDVTVAVIVQNVSGDLRLRGRSGNDLILEGDNPHLQQIGSGQPYLVRCDGDCRLMVPQTVDVIVQNVAGDAKLTDLGGTTEIGGVGGDLILRSVGSVQISAVGGDLRLKWAEGDVTIGSVGSDATVREIGGSVRIDNIGSDLYLRNVAGHCVVQNVGSDLVLNLDFMVEREYAFQAGGDILCRIQPDTNARFIVPADLAVGLDVPADVADSEDGQQQIITVGASEGAAVIQIHSAEELRLVGEEEDYVLDLGIQIEEELEARLSTLEEKLSQQLEGLDERIQARTEQIASQAERFAERAQRQAERAADRMRRGMEEREKGKGRPKNKRGRDFSMPRFEFSWGRPPGSPPEPPRRPSDPVTEQERLMILKMVQEGRISIEEAERLLSAIEGQD